MFKVRVECVLDKSVEDVFAAITDHENYKLFPGVNDSTLVEEGDNEKNGEGALRIIVAGPFEFTERITRFEKPSRMNYHIENSSPIPMRHEKGEITMEPIKGKTRVLWLSEGHMNVPIVGRVLDKVIQYKLSRAFRAMLNHIEVS